MGNFVKWVEDGSDEWVIVFCLTLLQPVAECARPIHIAAVKKKKKLWSQLKFNYINLGGSLFFFFFFEHVLYKEKFITHSNSRQLNSFSP